MSLQLIAKQMEAKGRKGDSMLVHMTPGEVEGLQKLAESMGGSLTVNPETGLVEANFLKKLISSPFFAPLAGAGLMMIPGVGPMMAAGLVGGGTALATGDVGKGAMAGLGAYGGAGLAGGLMGAGNAAASQAATAANPAVMGPMPGAASGFEAAKAGVSALGNEAGRSAFMQGVGGVGGLAKSAGMAAAPMLTQEQKTAEAPVDDEMYSYTFDPGRTGAERSPTSTSAEREYFRSSYSPLRRIKASQYGMAAGGLLSLAEGGPSGTSSEGMTGASKAAFDYLMGRSASSGSQGSVKGGSFSGGDGMYSFDPATGRYTRNPNYEDPEDKARREREEREREEERRRRNPPDTGRDDNDNQAGRPPNATDDTLRSPGDYVDTYDHSYDWFRDDQAGGSRAPDWVGLPADMRYDYNQAGNYDPSSGQSYAESVGMGGDYGYSGYSDGGDGGDGPDGWKDGGLLGLAKGGMASGGFVVPADVVSALGNGSTDAGLRKLYAMTGQVKPIKGKGDGLSDSIPTNIDGKQRARVADGEAYIDPKTVKRLGGAKKLYAMMNKIRAQAHGKTSQQRPVNPAKVMA